MYFKETEMDTALACGDNNTGSSYLACSLLFWVKTDKEVHLLTSIQFIKVFNPRESPSHIQTVSPLPQSLHLHNIVFPLFIEGRPYKP